MRLSRQTKHLQEAHVVQKAEQSIRDGISELQHLVNTELQHTGNAEPWRFLDQTESLFLSCE